MTATCSPGQPGLGGSGQGEGGKLLAWSKGLAERYGGI
jgi:hypothetical protein